VIKSLQKTVMKQQSAMNHGKLASRKSATGEFAVSREPGKARSHAAKDNFSKDYRERIDQRTLQELSHALGSKGVEKKEIKSTNNDWRVFQPF